MGNQVSRLPPSAPPSPLTPRAVRTTKTNSSLAQLFWTVLFTQCTQQAWPGSSPWRPPCPGFHPAPVSSRHVQLFPASCLWHGASRLGWALQLDHSCGLRLALENVREHTVEHLPAEGCVEGGAFVYSRGRLLGRDLQLPQGSLPDGH